MDTQVGGTFIGQDRRVVISAGQELALCQDTPNHDNVLEDFCWIFQPHIGRKDPSNILRGYHQLGYSFGEGPTSSVFPWMLHPPGMQFAVKIVQSQNFRPQLGPRALQEHSKDLLRVDHVSWHYNFSIPSHLTLNEGKHRALEEHLLQLTDCYSHIQTSAWI